MAEEKGSMARGMLIGFLAGAIAGAVTALLYAPKSGKELRSDIKQKANDLKEDAGEYMKVARSRASDLMAQGKVRTEQFTSEITQQAENILNDADKMLKDVRERAADESAKVRAAFRAGTDSYKGQKRHT